MTGWHLKKEVTIVQILTLISVVASAIWWAATVETRFVVLAGEDRRIEEKVDLGNLNLERILNRIERKQDKLYDKMDNKADKP